MHAILKAYFKIIRQFLPKQEATSSVGLDIGDMDCKIVEIQKKGENVELLSWAVESISKGDVAATIQKCLEHLKHPCSNIFTSIAGKGTLIRYIDMPNMSLEDLRNSFSLEADKYFPFPQDQIYTDCFIIDAKSKSSNMAVLVAAAKKDIVDKRVTLLKDLGFQPSFIGLNPLALANIIAVLGGGKQSSPDKATALLDIGESVTNLTISFKQLPRFTRDIFVGGKDLTKRISNALSVSFSEAEKLKKDPGSKKEDVKKAFDLVIMDIIHEIRLSFDYYMTEEGVEISKLYLTGGGAKLEGLIDKVGQQLEIDVEMWSPFDSVVLTKDVDEDELLKHEPQLAVALGLALYDYD